MLKIGWGLMANPWYWIFFGTCLIIATLLYFFQSQIIGWFGEHWTKKELEKLNKDKYKVINNVYIEVNGVMHQIDHVVVSKYGIFCIETKQYNGYITGGKWDKYWIRHSKNKEYKYTNPIRQNYGHILTLADLLSIDKNKIINVVCIPNDRPIKVTNDGEVVKYHELEYKILYYLDIVIDNPNEIYETIKTANIKNILKRIKYIISLKKGNKRDDNICPKCGGKLVKRNSQYGEFFGCSNFPKCKYTRNS